MTDDFLKTLQINENQNLSSKYLVHLIFNLGIHFMELKSTLPGILDHDRLILYKLRKKFEGSKLP